MKSFPFAENSKEQKESAESILRILYNQHKEGLTPPEENTETSVWTDDDDDDDIFANM